METYLIFTDGASRGNPGPASAAFIIKDSAGNLRLKCGNFLGIQTNNYAEYQAVLLALQKSAEVLTPAASCSLKFFLDSNLVVNQLSGKYQIKNPRLTTFAAQIKNLENKFANVEYNYIPRSQNKEADKLANLCLDKADGRTQTNFKSS